MTSQMEPPTSNRRWLRWTGLNRPRPPPFSERSVWDQEVYGCSTFVRIARFIEPMECLPVEIPKAIGGLTS